MLLGIGRMRVYQVDKAHDVMSGVGVGEILGSLVGSRSRVVVGVFWENVV